MRRSLQFPARLAATMVAVSFSAAGGAQEIPPDLLQDEFVREELGVNEFTTPSIEKLLRDVELLRPVPYEKVRRDPPSNPPRDRVDVALNIGGLIAQGIALVDAQKREDIEPMARTLLKHARALSVAESVMPRARSLIELGGQGDWDALRKELALAQADVEVAMLRLRDEELAHLVSIGGWIRALEISAISILENYTPERASILVRMDLLDYFIDRIETLHPVLRKRPVMIAMLEDLRFIRNMLDKPEGTAVYETDVREILDRSRKLNDMLYGESEAATSPPERGGAER